MTFDVAEPRSFCRFMNKFRILNHIKWSPQIIVDSVKQISDDLIATGTDYCWLRLSVEKYLRDTGLQRHELFKLLRDSFDAFAPNRVGLVLSVRYEAPRALQRQLLGLIKDDHVAGYLVGVDLVSDESYFDERFYAPLLAPWREAGKVVFAHVGESQPVRNVIRAVADMGVTDICHGLAVAETPLADMNPDVRGQFQHMMGQLRESGICFHMAMTSTYMTGLWHRIDWYPIVDILRSGNQVTVGTDDPIQCGTPEQPRTLDHEYGLLRSFGLTPDEIDRVKGYAVKRTECWRQQS